MKHTPIPHPKYISHNFRRIRCYPRSTPTFFIPIRSHIAWLWLATAPCPFYIVKATVVSFLLMLRDVLILPFSSTSTLLPSFVKHAQIAKSKCADTSRSISCDYSSSWNSLLLLKMPMNSTSTSLASSMLWSTPLLTKQPLLLLDWTKNWSISHYALPNTKILVTTERRQDAANVLVLTSSVHRQICRPSSPKRASS